MAAYYHGGGTDIQAGGGGSDGGGGLQTLYLMNPSYGPGAAAGYNDAGAGASMMLLNSAAAMTPASSFGHHQASQQQHFVGIPLQQPPPPGSSYHSLWTTPADMSSSSPPLTTTAAQGQGMQQQQHVSAVLSLSSSRTREAPVTVAAVAGDEDDGRYSHLIAPGAMAPSQGQGQVVMSSKYLRAAQELLDEVVSVSKQGGVDDDVDGKQEAAAKSVKKKEEDEAGEDAAGKSAPEMSTAERQELQMKKGKLVNMLDEVEQRYRQYHGQMRAVSSSFEALAGAGAARTYTALALRTISRQFRCLRDAIAGQIRAASRALGEDLSDAGGGGRGGVGSRLRYIDHQLRQQRALQQLGMMQGSSAWRPQRGLPERSVSVLRAWLFEHFLHPYPKDSDKIMLAKQTGLSRSQVSNWFINARVRLWKPMVEEMYLEETKEQQKQQGGVNGGDEAMAAAVGGIRSGGAAGKGSGGGGGESSTTPRAQMGGSGGFYDEIGDEEEEDGGEGEEEDDGFRRGLFKKARAAAAGDEPPPAVQTFDVAALHHHAQAAAAAAARQQHEEQVSHRELLMKFMESGGGNGAAAAAAGDHHDGGGGYSLFSPPGHPYAVGQFAGSDNPFAFAHGGGNSGGGVSLTLGLPHGAGEQTAASFLMGGGGNGGGSTGGADSGGGGYEMNLQMQSTKSSSFAAQLMRDFVA